MRNAVSTADGGRAPGPGALIAVSLGENERGLGDRGENRPGPAYRRRRDRAAAVRGGRAVLRVRTAALPLPRRRGGPGPRVLRERGDSRVPCPVRLHLRAERVGAVRRHDRARGPGGGRIRANRDDRTGRADPDGGGRVPHRLRATRDADGRDRARTHQPRGADPRGAGAPGSGRAVHGPVDRVRLPPPPRRPRVRDHPCGTASRWPAEVRQVRPAVHAMVPEAQRGGAGRSGTIHLTGSRLLFGCRSRRHRGQRESQ